MVMTINGSFAGLLTIVFVVLKLCNVITWGWIWVLSPLWISLAILIVILAVMFIPALIQDLIIEYKRRKSGN